MPSEKIAISSGCVLDEIFAFLETQQEQSVMYRSRIAKDSKVQRSSLPQPLAEKAILQMGCTVDELFRRAIPDKTPELPGKDLRFIAMVERMNVFKKARLLSIIRSIQEPWWLKFTDDASIKEKMLELLERRAPVIFREKNKESMPYLFSLTPFRDFSYVYTDIIPMICFELDVAYPYFMRLRNVPFYSREKDVDLIFMEYKLLSKINREIPYAFALAITGEEANLS